ncbi:(2Fe-2S)-binding protein, partial [Rhizobium johnstonii]
MITLNINGNQHEVDADPETPILWVLRDTLGMTGTKFGCGAALCGACTIHLDVLLTEVVQLTVRTVDLQGKRRRR